MVSNRIVEYVFFFGFMGVVGYLVWLIFAPFISALALSAIIVTICYPLYIHVIRYTPKQNHTAAALFTTLLVFLLVILPVVWLAKVLVGEAFSVYSILDSGQFSLLTSIASFESMLQTYIPDLELNLVDYIRQSAGLIASNFKLIFVGTVSTLFSFFIAIIGSFYFFRDGRHFTKQLIRISPLPDDEDSLILSRMAIAVRSVATGTILVALTQGVITAIGFSIIGFDRAVLLGTVAAFGALIPGVGTTIVFVPAVAYLLLTGSYVSAVLIAVWGMLAVGLIDNLLGPYLMSRGNTIHPFLILLAVLGGIILFGPIGFIVGPVIVSLFIVLLELYSQHIAIE